QPAITAASFAPLYRAHISSCSRPAFIRLFETACNSNNAEIRTLIQKEPLQGSQRDRFCSCVGEELWEWQKKYKAPPDSSIFAAGAEDAASICEAKPCPQRIG